SWAPAPERRDVRARALARLRRAAPLGLGPRRRPWRDRGPRARHGARLPAVRDAGDPEPRARHAQTGRVPTGEDRPRRRGARARGLLEAHAPGGGAAALPRAA